MDTLERLADEAIMIIGSVERAIDAIETNRKALAALLSQAADTPAGDGQEEGKVYMLQTWRATIAQLDQAIAVLRGTLVAP